MVTKDPDQEIQARIDLVFTTFLQVRTAMAVMRTLHARELALPRRDRHGDISWRPATLMAVVGMLRNPAYAGTFVYGRTRLGPSAPPGARPVQLPRSNEGWRFVVRDRYPAYIDVTTFEKIQAMLDDNQADYMRTKGRGIPRDGAALLHGIVWCGECGHKMAVRYKGGSQYVCNHLRQQHGAPVCQCLRAAAIDARVVAAFLEAIAPAELEAWSHARKAQRQADEAFHRAETQQVERLRYQAALAERQFNRVDPDNRLVAAELERRWETALRELRRAEAALARRTAAVASTKPDTIDPALAGQGREPRSPPARALGRSEHQPRAQEGAAALSDRQGGAAPARARSRRRAHRLAWRSGERAGGDDAGERADRAVALCGDGGARAHAGTGRGRRHRDRPDPHGRRAPFGAACHGGAAEHGSRHPAAARSQARARTDPLAAGTGLADSDRHRGTPASLGEMAPRPHPRRSDPNPAQVFGRYLFPDDERALKILRQLRANVVKQVDLMPHALQHQGHHHA